MKRQLKMDATVTLYLQTQLAVYHAWSQRNYPIPDGLHHALQNTNRVIGLVDIPRDTSQCGIRYFVQ